MSSRLLSKSVQFERYRNNLNLTGTMGGTHIDDVLEHSR